jgi:DNA-directed RNA polymerase subunit RPC12/RpoP
MALAVLAILALVALALFRGRLVSIALAASECPDCRVPFVRVRADERVPPDERMHPDEHGAARSSSEAGDPPWEVYACPQCERVVTAVGAMPSPVAECPACRQRSLVVYAERAEGGIVVDEWCDLCARRARTVVAVAAASEAPKPPAESPSRMGRVLPFRKEG